MPMAPARGRLFYGIDRQGNIRFAKFGGGNFESVIEAVQKLKEFG